MCKVDKPIAIGPLEMPEAEVVDEPWIFRAAWHCRDVDTVEGSPPSFMLVLDLGFRIYRQIDCLLSGCVIAKGMSTPAGEFVENWIENGRPNPLWVTVHEPATVLTNDHGEAFRNVIVERTLLDAKTLRAIGRESLVDALVEQGLAKRA